MAEEREEYEAHGAATLPDEDVRHPGPRQYVVVALALAFITGLEVALFYTEFLAPVVVTGALLTLMTIKFATVVLWFMHLRFDSPIYKRLFLTGLALALFVFLFVLLMFGAGFLPATIGVGLVLVLLAVLMVPRLRRA